MKKFLFVFSTLIISSLGFAQDRTSGYTGSFFNFTRNASYAGAEELTNLFLDARTVAGNLPGGNQNFQFGMNTMAGEGNGLGLKFVSDNQGPLRSTNFELTFAKRFQIAKDQYIAFGTNAGFIQTSLNTSALTNFVDLSDPTINNGYYNQPRFTAGFGARYQFKNDLDLGVSAPMLVTGNTPINNTIIANANYTFRFGKENAKNKLTPWVVYYYISSQSMLDGGLKFTMHDLVAISAGYRTNGSVLASAMVNARSFSIGYAFNYSTGSVNNLYLGTNELLLSLNFASFKHGAKPIDATTQADVESRLQAIKGDLSSISNKVGQGNTKDVQSSIDHNNSKLRKLLKEFKVDGNDNLRNEVVEIKKIIEKLENQLKELKSKSTPQ